MKDKVVIMVTNTFSHDSDTLKRIDYIIIARGAISALSGMIIKTRLVVESTAKLEQLYEA